MKGADVERIAVQSRDLALVGYEDQKQLLEVTFRSGGVYRYTGVPKNIVKEFLGSSSLGKYFNDHIKEAYPAEKVS